MAQVWHRNAQILKNLLVGDMAMLWVGDSFSKGTNTRAALAAIRMWPFVNNFTGLFISGRNNGLCALANDVTDGSGVDNFQSIETTTGGYGLCRSGLTSADGEEFNGLPVDVQVETFFGAGGSDNPTFGTNGRIFRTGINYTKFDGVHGHFMSLASDQKLAVGVYYKPITINECVNADIRLYDDSNLRISFNPNAGSSGYFDVTDPFQLSNNPTVQSYLSVHDASSSAIGSNRHLIWAGHLRYHADSNGDRLPGLSHLGTLADNSWSWEDMGNGAPVTHDEKSFNSGILGRYLYGLTGNGIITSDIAYMMYFAAEVHTVSEWITIIQSVINTFTSAHDYVGTLGNPIFCIIIPHYHDLGGDEEDHFEAFQEAAYTLATGNICALSLWEALERREFLDSSDNDFLESNPFGIDGTDVKGVDLTGAPYNGKLLDSSDLHPEDEYCAAFYFGVIGQMILQAEDGDFKTTFHQFQEEC